jgi:hypothetical protein
MVPGTAGYKKYGKVVVAVRMLQVVYIAYKVFKAVKLKILFNSGIFYLRNFIRGDVFALLHLCLHGFRQKYSLLSAPAVALIIWFMALFTCLQKGARALTTGKIIPPQRYFTSLGIKAA